MQREAAVKAANERHQKFMLGSPDPRVRALADPNLTPEQRAALPAPDYFAPISKEEQARVDAYIKETRHQEISREPVQINEQAFYFEFHFEPIIENPFTTLPPRDAVLTFT